MAETKELSKNTRERFEHLNKTGISQSAINSTPKQQTSTGQLLNWHCLEHKIKISVLLNIQVLMIFYLKKNIQLIQIEVFSWLLLSPFSAKI